VAQPNGTSWDKLEYVGQVGQGQGGLQILVGQVGQGEGGLQIFVGQVGQGQGVCPLEPVHLSQMGLQGRENFLGTTIVIIDESTLIERTPLPQGGFLFTMFLHQEPCVRGPPSKNLVHMIRKGSSHIRFLMREHSK